MEFVDLKKDELISLIDEYDDYIQNANDDGRMLNGWCPVCIHEYLNNEFYEAHHISVRIMRTLTEIEEKREKLEEDWREQFNAQKATRKGEIHGDMDPFGRELMSKHYKAMADTYIDQMAILDWALETE